MANRIDGFDGAVAPENGATDAEVLFRGLLDSSFPSLRMCTVRSENFLYCKIGDIM